MAEGHLEKAQPGAPFRPRASDWNAFIDAANYTRSAGRMGTGPSGALLPPGVVWVRNSTATDYEKYDALWLANQKVAITPSQNETEFESQMMLRVGGVRDSDYDYGVPYVVLLDPLPANGYGRAMIAGTMVTRLNVAYRYHRYATLVQGESRLTTVPLGDARIVWLDGGSKSERWGIVQFPVEHGQQILVSSAVDIADGYCCAISCGSGSANPPQWIATLSKPTADSQQNVIAYSGAGLKAGVTGRFSMRVTPIVRLLVDVGQDYAVLNGYEYGSVAGSWSVVRGNSGFVAIGQETVNGVVYGYFYPAMTGLPTV